MTKDPTDYPCLLDWLLEHDFDFETGVILLRFRKYIDEETNQEKVEPICQEWHVEKSTYHTSIVDRFHPVLRQTFNAGFGGAEAPAIYAKDNKAIYFISEYDGATSMEHIMLDPKHYLNNELPYI